MMLIRLTGFLYGFLWAGVPSATAQEILPQGAIAEDTIRTGGTFSYSLSYRHPLQQEVFFPDSGYNFYPFRFVGQEVFVTKTGKGLSLDSAIYKLISFEVTPRIHLSLPVFVWDGKDCTAVFPAADSAVVRLLVDRESLDTLSVRTEMGLLPMRKQVNYSMVLASVLVLGLAVFGVYWLLGEKINRQWRVFRLRRRHRDFTKNFNRHYLNAKNKESIPDIEMALVLWKRYLERVEKKPFTTFTTREISDNITDKSLRFALHEIDEIIYGSTKTREIGNALPILKKVAQEIYLQKRREIIRTQLKEDSRT